MGISTVVAVGGGSAYAAVASSVVDSTGVPSTGASQRRNSRPAHTRGPWRGHRVPQRHDRARLEPV